MPLQPPNVILNRSVLFNPIGNHMQMTQTTVAVTLTPPAGADRLMIQVTGSLDARYIVGGTVDPTTVSGFLLNGDEAPSIIQVDVDTVIVVVGESDVDDTVIEYQWGGTHRA